MGKHLSLEKETKTSYKALKIFKTNSKTLPSFWSPQMSISDMARSASTMIFRLGSVSFSFFCRTFWRYLRKKIKRTSKKSENYFRYSREWGFFGFQSEFELPPKRRSIRCLYLQNLIQIINKTFSTPSK